MFSYKEYGNPKKFPLIFFHGFLGNKYDWEGVIKLLMSDFLCITIDLPGHGKSKIDNKASFESFAKDFTEFLKANKLEDAALIGYSMGGRIAHYIHEYYLNKQICICIGSHLGLNKEEEIKNRKIWNEEILSHINSKAIENFLIFWYSQKIFDSFKQSKIYSNTLNCRKNNNKELLKKAFSAFSVLNQNMLHPDSKTFFLAGCDDYKYLKYYQKIKCPYQVVPNASHPVHLENPKGLVKKLKEILHGQNQLGSNQRI